MKAVLITALFLVGAATEVAWAGTGAGNGGDGFISNGKLYSLDLYERGLELNPFFDSRVIPSSELRMRTSLALSNLKLGPTGEALVAQKLAEVARLSPVFGNALLIAMEQYEWVIAREPVAEIDDEDSAFALDPKRLIQIAVRASRTIFVDKVAWRELDEVNRVALVFHEMIYALQDPMYENGWAQNAARTREVTAFLFSEAFSTSDLSQLQDFLSPEYPVTSGDVLPASAFGFQPEPSSLQFPHFSGQSLVHFTVAMTPRPSVLLSTVSDVGTWVSEYCAAQTPASISYSFSATSTRFLAWNYFESTDSGVRRTYLRWKVRSHEVVKTILADSTTLPSSILDTALKQAQTGSSQCQVSLNSALLDLIGKSLYGPLR